jgi:hypothetical protein
MHPWKCATDVAEKCMWILFLVSNNTDGQYGRESRLSLGICDLKCMDFLLDKPNRFGDMACFVLPHSNFATMSRIRHVPIDDPINRK